jgi:endoglucanase
MRIFLTFLLSMVYLCGCSQSATPAIHSARKIRIDAKRWYQLNNTTYGLDELFDGNLHRKPFTGNGKILDNYDAWYPVLDGEQMTIDSIAMYDWEGISENHPVTIYAITDDWKRVPIAVFKGSGRNKWNGPDPSKPDVYALNKPVANIKYLVINSWGEFPAEIEFYGSYAQPKLFPALVKKAVPLSNFFGINAFEWDFEGPPDPTILDQKRLSAIKSFTGVRHYMDWVKLESKEGDYTFNTTENGTWNYDTIYQWCKANSIEVLACLKTIPDWMQDSYPKDKRGDENVPLRYGKDPAEPGSYIEQARVAFQYAARYGDNRHLDPKLVSVDPSNQKRIGMGVVHYIECDNERDKWWKGRQAYQTGREYAANLSAFYDGNKNKMGQGVGVKNADTGMKVVIAGLAAPNTDFVRGIIDWSLQYRGRKADGTADLPFDIINYHYYNNDADYVPDRKQTKGSAPELTNAAATAKQFIEMAHQYAGDRPVWITETGYDLNQESVQRAPAIGKRTAQEIQAAWILRTSLLYARAGIQKVFYYQLVDDNSASGGNFASCGLINAADRTRRPAADFLYQVNKLFGAYIYAETINKDPIVDRYTCNGQSMFVLLVPDEKGRTASYTLDLGTAVMAYIYSPKPGSDNMDVVQKKTVNGKVDILVTETPVFVTGG